jgi:DNA/RNA endonuclease YhcR with UshA esterase domain
MKYLFLLFLVAAATFTASAQAAVSLDSVSQHIGDSVTTKGAIYGVRYFPNAKGSPTLINIGAAYPGQVLTVVIPQEVRNAMATVPSEATLKGKTVLIRGKLELYKDKPQVVINHPSQLQVVDDKGEVLPFH